MLMPKRLSTQKRLLKPLPLAMTFASSMFIVIMEFSHPQNLHNILMPAASAIPFVELAHIGKMEL